MEKYEYNWAKKGRIMKWTAFCQKQILCSMS